jgi:23S rRNA (pseudouridine1915-N3)-methyltransferase
MRIAVISASSKQPEWIRDGFDAYARRLRGSVQLELREVGLAKRHASTPLPRQIADEGRRMLAAAPKGARLVALDSTGRDWSTADLAARLEAWIAGGSPVALLIGGPDGLAPEVLEQSDERWALSALTLPHGLVRIVAAEAVYRAWSLLEHHPYHRE